MRKLSDVRRDNLRVVIDRMGGGTKVAAKMGYRNGSFLSQMVGPNPSREITEKTARRMEADLGLTPGALDVEPQDQPVAAPAAAGLPTSVIADVIRLLGSVLVEEKVTLSPDKFADVAALAVEDAADRGGKPREAHVRSLVRLVK